MNYPFTACIALDFNFIVSSWNVWVHVSFEHEEEIDLLKMTEFLMYIEGIVLFYATPKSFLLSKEYA